MKLTPKESLERTVLQNLRKNNKRWFTQEEFDRLTYLDNKLFKGSNFYSKSSERKPVNLDKQSKEVCDCSPKQACKICAESKDIDWSIIEPKAK